MSFVDSIAISGFSFRNTHGQGADSMAISAFSFRNASVGSGWATAVLLCMNWLRNQSSHLARRPFLVGKFFPSLEEWLLAECRNYCKLINGGCGLSHRCVEDDCNSSLGAENPTELRIW